MGTSSAGDEVAGFTNWFENITYHITYCMESIIRKMEL
jgi:hypothetical protein